MTEQKTTRKPEVQKKRPFKKLAAAAVLAGGLAAAACAPDVNINLIPYAPGGDGGAGACLSVMDGSTGKVKECQKSEDNEMRTGQMVIVGNTAFKLAGVVNSGATMAARFTPIDGADECSAGNSEDILSGNTKVLTIDGKQYGVKVSAIEYDSVGAKVTVSVTPACHQEPDLGADKSV